MSPLQQECTCPLRCEKRKKKKIQKSRFETNLQRILHVCVVCIIAAAAAEFQDTMSIWYVCGSARNAAHTQSAPSPNYISPKGE